MRRIAALILGIVYMAFTFSAMGYSHSNSVYQHAVSAISDCESEDVASCTAHYEATGHFKKAPKHHAPSGKVKVPRPGHVNINFAHAQLNASGVTIAYRNATEIEQTVSNNLYLKNRVFRI